MASLSAKELLAQLEALASNPPAELLKDSILRTKLSIAARKASLSLEKPEDVIARVLLSQVSRNIIEAFAPPTRMSQTLGEILTGLKPVEGITVRIAIDLKLFAILKDGTKTLDQLVEATKATPVVLSSSKVPYLQSMRH